MKKFAFWGAAILLISSSYAVMKDDQIRDSFNTYLVKHAGATANQYIENLAQEAMNEKDLDKAETVLSVYGKVKPFKAGKFLEAGSNEEKKAYTALFQALDVVYEKGNWRKKDHITESKTDGKINLQRFFRRYLLGNPDPDIVDGNVIMTDEKVILQSPKNEKDLLEQHKKQNPRIKDPIESVHGTHLQKLFDVIRLFLAKREEGLIDDEIEMGCCSGEFYFTFVKSDDEAGSKVLIRYSNASNFDGPDFFPDQEKLQAHIKDELKGAFWRDSPKREEPSYDRIGYLHKHFHDYEEEWADTQGKMVSGMKDDGIMPDIKQAIVSRFSSKSKEAMSLVSKSWRYAINQARQGKWVYLYDPEKITEIPFGRPDLQPWVGLGYSNFFPTEISLSAGMRAIKHLYNDKSNPIQSLKFSYSKTGGSQMSYVDPRLDEEDASWTINGLQFFELSLALNTDDPIDIGYGPFVKKLTDHNNALKHISFEINKIEGFHKVQRAPFSWVNGMKQDIHRNKIKKGIKYTFRSKLTFFKAPTKEEKEECLKKFKADNPEYVFHFDEEWPMVPWDNQQMKIVNYTINTKE